ncbi:MAG TPA: HigA family addiction module antitoxin [Steroidobacteraceae bacterium]
MTGPLPPDQADSPLDGPGAGADTAIPHEPLSAEKRPPAPPGCILLCELMKSRNLSVFALSEELGVAPARVSEIVQDHKAITIEMALRFARYFGNSARVWLAVHDDTARTA